MNGEARLPVSQTIVAVTTNNQSDRHRLTITISSCLTTCHRGIGYSYTFGILIHLIFLTAEVEGLVLIIICEGQRSDIRLVRGSQTTIG